MHTVEVTFKVKVKIEGALPDEAMIQVGIWAERFCEVGVFEDASEEGTCTPKITCGRGEVEDIEVLKE